MRYRSVVAAAGLCAAAVWAAAQQPALPASRPLTRIAFGSCALQTQPQPIWERLLALKPQLFVSLGDIVYVDAGKWDEARQAYRTLDAIPGFKRLRASVPMMAIWDDGEIGVNDAGAEPQHRDTARQLFLEFLREPRTSPRWTQDGLYEARVIGPPGKRVQIILLDTRYNRSPLTRRVPVDERFGRYERNPDPTATMLGETQWRWLEEQLRVPAEIRLIGSGIQVVAEDHNWEKWENLPNERRRLFDLIRTTGARGVIFLSGDRHHGEISVTDGGAGYPLYDITASGFNVGHSRGRTLEENRHRVGTLALGHNFGMLLIAWPSAAGGEPLIRLQIRDENGDIRIQEIIPLSLLQPAGHR
jgi:alkaline phosphatase D